MSDSLGPQWTVAHQAPLSMGSPILEWAAMPSSRGSSQLRDKTQVSRIAGRFFTIWATREAHFKRETCKSLSNFYGKKIFFDVYIAPPSQMFSTSIYLNFRPEL